MEQRQPPIYHSCLQLSRLVFSITRHFQKKANYEEGAELRRASVEAVKECLPHFKTYRVRKRLAHLMPAEWWDKVYVRGHYEKIYN